MTNKQLTVTTPSDREIRIARAFDAPREHVFKALTMPELLKRWLLGPPGWTMPVCEIDLRVGGKYRYEWRNENGAEMGMGGEFVETDAPERLVATEQFDEAWYPGKAIVRQELSEDNGATTLTITIRYESQEGRDTALKTGMEDGMAAGYARLDEVLLAL